MKKIKEITEDEVIGIFLQTEINSKRWGETLKDYLARDQKLISLVEYPDYKNNDENDYRRNLLGKFRGYGNNTSLFENFPTKVKWQKIILKKEELKKIKYMNYSYWNELSANTRLAIKGAENVLSGIIVFGESDDGFLNAAKAIKEGVKFPPIILVTENLNNDLIVLEGHQRITAYLMSYSYLPDELEVIVGHSNVMHQWSGY